MFKQIYQFFKGPDNLGVGVSNLGLARSSTLPIYSTYDPAYNVRRSLGPTAPGYAKLQQRLVPVSLLGQGSDLTGQFVAQNLSQMEGK